MSTVAPLQNTAVKPQQSSSLERGGLLLQRQCACGSPTSSLTGKCEACNGKKKSLQAKLTIGASNDPLELEADRVADQVLAAPLNSTVSAAPPRIQRFTGQMTGQMDTAPASVDRVLASSGRPMEPALRQDMEQRFGHDFSQVRVHSGGEAEQSAQEVHANAYTVGHNIVFGARRFAPGTHEGRRLIAHELTHVVQQSDSDGIRVGQSNENRSALTVSHKNNQLTSNHELEHQNDGGIPFDVEQFNRSLPCPKSLQQGLVLRRMPESDESPKIERSFELNPNLFNKFMDAPAIREVEKCEEFPGGRAECEIDEESGTPTGKVTSRIYETNPCTRPCVERHESVHVRQLKLLCPKVRDCYIAADQGKRSVTECFSMTISGISERECEAYKISVPCVENRLKNARECQSKKNIDLGKRKLASERCFQTQYCGSSGRK